MQYDHSRALVPNQCCVPCRCDHYYYPLFQVPELLCMVILSVPTLVARTALLYPRPHPSDAPDADGQNGKESGPDSGAGDVQRSGNTSHGPAISLSMSCERPLLPVVYIQRTLGLPASNTITATPATLDNSLLNAVIDLSIRASFVPRLVSKLVLC